MEEQIKKLFLTERELSFLRSAATFGTFLFKEPQEVIFQEGYPKEVLSELRHYYWTIETRRRSLEQLSDKMQKLIATAERRLNQ